MNSGNEERFHNEARSRSSIGWHFRVLLALLLLGLAARVAITNHVGWSTAPREGSDAWEFDSYAWNIAQGHGYSGISPDVYGPDGQPLVHPTAYRSPGTPVLWAGMYWCFGHRYSVVRISQCVLDTLTILLLFGIGRECFDDKVALTAAAIYALWPTALLYTSQLGSEPLYTFLFCGAILASLQFAERPTWARAIGAGVVFGLAMETRGNAVLMVLMMMPWAAWQFRKTPRLVVRGLAISFVALVMLVPWTIRNYRIFHAFVPFQTEGGDTLLGSYNGIVANDPNYYGYWVYPTSNLPELSRQIKAPNNEVDRDHVETRLAVEWMRAHPEKMWYLVWSKFRRSLTPFLQPQDAMLYRVCMLVSWGPVLVFFALGFFPIAIYFLRTNNPGWILQLGVLHFLFTALIFYGASRFRYPVEGLCILLACASFFWLWKILGKFFSRRRALRGQEPANAN
ncbi:MAG: glycosyltransferase family 39 protein [Terracidiphilus sp.]